MKKFRIKLKSNRVVGPFVEEQVIELYKLGKITGDEQIQIFPTGDWLSLSSYKEFEEITKIIQSSENTTLRKLSDLNLHQNVEIENTAAESEDIIDTPVELEQVKEFKIEPLPVKDVEIEPQVKAKVEIEVEIEEEPSPESLTESDSSKTVIRKDTIEFLEESKRIEENKRKLSIQKEKEEKVLSESAIDYDNDSTQMISSNSSKLSHEAAIAEKELKSELRKHKSNELKKLAKSEAEFDDEDDEEDEEEGGNGKRKFLIITLLIICGFVFLFPEEKVLEKKIITPITVDFYFPMEGEVTNKDNAQNLLADAFDLYRSGLYFNKVRAVDLLHNSLSLNYEDTNARILLMLLYSELLPVSKNISIDANLIFKMLQIHKPAIISNEKVVRAFVNFYKAINKIQSAKKVLEEFIVINSGKQFPIEIWTELLKLQTLLDDDSAEKTLGKVLKYKNKSIRLYSTILDYHFAKNEFQKIKPILLESMEKFPKSTKLKLYQAELHTLNQNYKKLAETLDEINSLGAEKSPIYYSRYLEYEGILYFVKKDIKNSKLKFEKALSYNNSDRLRARIITLYAESEDASSLILESKSLQLINKSKKGLKTLNWKVIFKNAFDAVEIAPNFITAEIHLANMQARQGLFKDSLNTLTRLAKKYPNDSNVIFSLIDVSLQSYKIRKVKELIANNESTELAEHPDYYKYFAMMFYQQGKNLQAINWFTKAINKNPIDDKMKFQLAEIFIEFKKFTKAQILLNKAIELDPSNVEYRAKYGEILYELEDVETAIGYTREMLKKFPDHPLLLGDLGIYYFKSNQLKFFEDIKERLSGLKIKNRNMYEFLIKSAMMDRDYESVIEYGQELIDIDPGDLDTMMLMAKLYIDLEKYKDAKNMLSTVKSKLDSYPKLKYLFSLLAWKIGKLDKAIEFAKEEISGNPTSVDGYLLLGDIYMEKKQYSEADKNFKQAQKLDYNNVDALIGLAKLSYMSSQFEIALDLFRKALSEQPNNPKIHHQLGEVYKQLGQSALAIESYKIFLELEPNTKYKRKIEDYMRLVQ